MLEGELERIGETGRDVCRLLGMTNTWATSRWEVGPTPDTLIPTFAIAVSGQTPGRDVIDLITARLKRAGWSGALLSLDPDLRLDAHKDTSTLSLTASSGVIRLRVTTPPVRLGRTFATWIRAGVYDDDEIS